jgi:hypothetical protein
MNDVGKEGNTLYIARDERLSGSFRWLSIHWWRSSGPGDSLTRILACHAHLRCREGEAAERIWSKRNDCMVVLPCISAYVDFIVVEKFSIQPWAIDVNYHGRANPASEQIKNRIEVGHLQVQTDTAV